jgi:propionate CoA-transferase
VPLGKVLSADDAVHLIRPGDVLAVAGYGGSGVAEDLLVALERRFTATAAPRDLTLVHATGIGDGRDQGLNRLAHDGLLRRVITSFYGLAPRLGQMAVDGRVEAYALPQGIIVDLFRAIGAGKPGVVSRVGLGTFVDPRQGGGKVNARTVQDLVEVIELDGAEALFFRAFPIQVAFIRGTTADPDGNVTLEREALTLEHLALAIAARNSGGYVACQVER